MLISEFVQYIRTLKEESDEEYTSDTYYISIDKTLKKSKVNRSWGTPIPWFAYMIVVAPYRWHNLGYVNQSLKMIGMYNRNFEKIDSIPFDKWELKSIKFMTALGQRYSAWSPYPYMEKRNNPSESTCEYLWDSKDFYLQKFDEILDAIWKLESIDIFGKDISTIIALCKKHKVNKLFAFGSILTNPLDNESDVDLTVDFEDIPLENYVDNYMEFKDGLSKILDREIDLLEDKAIRNPVLRRNIDESKRLIYERIY